MTPTVFAETNGFVVFLIVIGFFAAVAIVALVIHKITNPKIKEDNDDKDKKEKQILQEELDRVLQPVEDDELSNQIQNYKEDE